MNFSPLILIIATAGGILIYSAVKGYNPTDVVKSAVGGAAAEPVYQYGDRGEIPSSFGPQSSAFSVPRTTVAGN